MSSPRAATSDATSSLIEPSRNAFSVAIRTAIIEGTPAPESPDAFTDATLTYPIGAGIVAAVDTIEGGSKHNAIPREAWATLVLPEGTVEAAVAGLKARFGRRIAVVETAYPWTMEGRDPAGNILGEDSLEPGFPATRNGQSAFLGALRNAVLQAGGEGVIYWEPAWISSSCETRWGVGSHWENATLFDFEGRLLPGAAVLLTPIRP